MMMTTTTTTMRMIAHLYNVASYTFKVFRPSSSVNKDLSTETFLFTALRQHVQQTAIKYHRYVVA